MTNKDFEDDIEVIEEQVVSGAIELVTKESEHTTYCYFVHPDPQHKIDKIESEFVANNLEQTKDGSIRLLLAKIDTNTQNTEIYPVILNYDSPNFLNPKYGKITTLAFHGYSLEFGRSANNMDILFGLPRNIDSVFQKTLLHGLGFRQAYNYIPNIINSQQLDIDTLFFSKTDLTHILQNESKIVISQKDLIALRQGLNRIGYEKGHEKSDESNVFVYNTVFNKYQPKTFPAMKIKRKLSVVFRQLQNVDINPTSLSSGDKEQLAHSKAEIDLNYFKSLCIDFKKLLEKRGNEEKYQKFFNNNPLILTVITGLPYYRFKEKAYMGGKTISNQHGEVTDFLLKHSIIANTAIVEIKTPYAHLLNRSEYRDGVFAVSTDVSGAINQVLTQRSSFMRSAADLMAEDNFHVYNPQGFIILGHLDELDTNAKKRSFELFRTSQKDVKIVTYDECLALLEMFVKNLSDDNK
jgi:hypothetical protein